MSNEKYVYDEYWFVGYTKDGQRSYAQVHHADDIKSIIDNGATDLYVFTQNAVYPFFIN